MHDDELSRTFAALADPTRRAILEQLKAGESSVTALAEPFDMSLPAISKHLRVLEHAGLVTRGQQAQWRPRRLDAQPLADVARWLDGYRDFMTGSLDRLDLYLQELQRPDPDPKATDD